MRTGTSDDYARIFAAECAVEYPAVDAFEATAGAALERFTLERAARVLACPLKAHAPNWQHGRILYAAVRRYARTREAGPLLCVDIGTAKGFSALCLTWAATDAGRAVSVWSCDVLDPSEPVRRNTVAEVDGPLPLRDILAPWPETLPIQFVCSDGAGLLKTLARQQARIDVAFIDGKHTYAAVARETDLLAPLQHPGDLVIFDDAQIDGVAQAITAAADRYAIETVIISPSRRYAIGTRRG